MDWTTPEDIRDELNRAWDRGRILAARVTSESLFPMKLRMRRPERRALSDRFDEVRAWIRLLDEGSRTRLGYGYDVEWIEIDHRQLGRNRIPDALVVPTEADALQLIGKKRASERFDPLAALTIERLPALRDWLARKPLKLLEHADAWSRIVDVVSWLRAHPRSGVYVRQIDLPGVDTKFIEEHRWVIAELLEIVLPAEQRVASPSFEKRFGLRPKPALVRFRLLDRRASLAGLTDVTTPVAQLAANPVPARTLFITENEINGLAFPAVDDAIVIFGLGYGIDTLAELSWLNDREVHYWGDIDTHGFVMLDRLRAAFPHARSMLMDRATLMAHRAQWVEERVQHKGPLLRLAAEEQHLFDDLVANKLGDRVRLEQERIAFGQLEAALRG